MSITREIVDDLAIYNYTCGFCVRSSSRTSLITVWLEKDGSKLSNMRCISAYAFDTRELAEEALETFRNKWYLDNWRTLVYARDGRTIKADELYQTYAQIPEGFKILDFRRVNESDKNILTYEGKIAQSIGQISRDFYDGVRLILTPDTKPDKQVSKTMTITEAYKLLHQKCGIEVGDKVRLLRYPNSYEHGWPDTNPKGGAGVEQIGNIYTVKTINDASIRLDYYTYPFFCLELVEKAKPTYINVQLNSQYTATVSKTELTVGCQTIPIEKLAELQEALRKLQ